MSDLILSPWGLALLLVCAALVGAVCTFIGGRVWDSVGYVKQSDLDARWAKMTEHYEECFDRQSRIVRRLEVDVKVFTEIDANARLIQADAERANLQAQMDAVVTRVNAIEERLNEPTPKPRKATKRKGS